VHQKASNSDVALCGDRTWTILS